MNEYNPESWVIIKITNEAAENPLYKVFGSWRGGFATGDSWRLNSGINKMKELKDDYIFYGHSGSAYSCYKKSEGTPMGAYNSGILANLLKQLNDKDGITAEIVKASEITLNENSVGHRDGSITQEDPPSSN